jgi:membrane protease YdiL (CAAX protease family)
VSSLSGFAILSAMLVAAAIPFLKEQPRKIAENIALLLCTICVVIFFGQIIQGESSSGKLQAQVSEERAESALKFMGVVNVGVAKISELLGPIQDERGHTRHAIDLSTSGLSKYFATAEDSLKSAINGNPAKPALKAKLIVLLAAWEKDRKLMISTCTTLQESKVESERKLGNVLYNLCVVKKPGSNIKDQVQIIEAGIPKGWYQENANLMLYKLGGDLDGYRKFATELEESYWKSFRMGAALILFGCFAAFIGVVVIIIQLGSLGRGSGGEPRLAGLDLAWKLSWREIYAVFVGWLSSQMAIAEGLKLLPRGILSLGHNNVGIAIFSLVSYLLTMLPALVLIYLIVVRPRKLNFLTALGLNLRVGDVFKLALSGFLSWCAIIPLVLISATIASAFLGSQGSDNPILAQIASISSSGNILAIVILFSTVAMLAPFCEEIIFRAFLYSAARRRIGIFPAVLLSSLVFAFIHFDKGGTLMLLALGPVLALAYERTRSLWPSMIAHGLWNGGAFAVTLALFSS